MILVNNKKKRKQIIVVVVAVAVVIVKNMLKITYRLFLFGVLLTAFLFFLIAKIDGKSPWFV